MFQLKPMIVELDRDVGRLLSRQDRESGLILREDGFNDTRGMGFSVARMLTAYLHVSSGFCRDSDLAKAILLALRYLKDRRRPSGMFDLATCNFDSAPDTAFTVNALLDVYVLLKDASDRNPGDEDLQNLHDSLLEIMEEACRGMCTAGFHTPNHRWAISACLKTAAPYVRDAALAHAMQERADFFLKEGLDQDADGEFAERSAGTYNAVNDDQMLHLYLATKDETYLQAAGRNLRLMRCFLEPDGTLFTQHSTRQDKGQRVWPSSYCSLYLLAGWLLREPELAATGHALFDLCSRQGKIPHGLPMLMRFPEMWTYGAEAEHTGISTSYSRLLAASGLVRERDGDFCVTVRKHAPDFLYICSGDTDLVLDLYCNVCDKRNFAAETLEQTGEHTYELTCTFPGWYYLPFQDAPDTTDWWQMDNSQTREREIRGSMTVTIRISVDRKAHAVELAMQTSGLDRVPLCLECGFSCGTLRTAVSSQKGLPGTELFVLSGDVQVSGQDGSVLTLGPCFAKHTVSYRMGGAFPRDPRRVTVCLTEVSPCSRTLRIGTEPVYEMISAGESL